MHKGIYWYWILVKVKGGEDTAAIPELLAIVYNFI